MVVKNSFNHIVIPIWLLKWLIPLVISFLIFVISNLSSQAVIKSKVENIDSRLNRIENILINSKTNEVLNK